MKLAQLLEFGKPSIPIVHLKDLHDGDRVLVSGYQGPGTIFRLNGGRNIQVIMDHGKLRVVLSDFYKILKKLPKEE